MLKRDIIKPKGNHILLILYGEIKNIKCKENELEIFYDTREMQNVYLLENENYNKVQIITEGVSISLDGERPQVFTTIEDLNSFKIVKDEEDYRIRKINKKDTTLLNNKKRYYLIEVIDKRPKLNKKTIVEEIRS